MFFDSVKVGNDKPTILYLGPQHSVCSLQIHWLNEGDPEAARFPPCRKYKLLTSRMCWINNTSQKAAASKVSWELMKCCLFCRNSFLPAIFSLVIISLRLFKALQLSQHCIMKLSGATGMWDKDMNNRASCNTNSSEWITSLGLTVWQNSGKPLHQSFKRCLRNLQSTESLHKPLHSLLVKTISNGICKVASTMQQTWELLFRRKRMNVVMCCGNESR